MKEKIDNLVNKVRDNFSIINKTLKEIELYNGKEKISRRIRT